MRGVVVMLFVMAFVLKIGALAMAPVGLEPLSRPKRVKGAELYVVINTPRGIRNNNPGNLRKTSINWKGEVIGDDPDFEQFESMEMGVRALTKNLLYSMEVLGNNTLRNILLRWAPPTENKTEDYIRSVSLYTGLDPDEVLGRQHLYDLTKAIIRHENGQLINDKTIHIGIYRALYD
jgi:hypothetical protein